MDEKVARLKSAIDEVLSDPRLKKIRIERHGKIESKTYCNVGAYRICRKMGYDGFWNRDSEEFYTANEMYDICKRDWRQVNSEWAGEFARSGGLAVAAQKGDPHGHIAVVAPLPDIYSGKWGTQVPMVANVGQENKIEGTNFAFSTMPDFFVYDVKT